MKDFHELKDLVNHIKFLLIKITTIWRHLDHVQFPRDKQQRLTEFIYITSTKIYQPNLINICQKLILIKNPIISTKETLPHFPSLITSVNFFNQREKKNKDTYRLIHSCVPPKCQNTCIKFNLLLLSNSGILKIRFIKVKGFSEKVLPKHLIFIK